MHLIQWYDGIIDKLLQTLIVPKKMPVGLQLLRTMGYREGDAVGTSIETIERDKAKAAYVTAAATSSTSSSATSRKTYGVAVPPSIQSTIDEGGHDDIDESEDATIDWESIVDPDEQQAAKEKWMSQLAARAGRSGGAAGLGLPAAVSSKGKTAVPGPSSGSSGGAPKRTELYSTTKKDDLFGIGFDPSLDNGEMAQHRRDRDTLLRLENPSDSTDGKSRRGRMAMDSFGKGNSSFGMGALEDGDGTDDPYGGTGMEQYDIEIGSNRRGGAKKSTPRGVDDQSYHTISFVPADRPPPPIVVFKPIVVPADWMPVHRFTHDSVVVSKDLESLLRSSDSAQYAATLGIGNMSRGNGRGTGGLSADQRGSMLGERVLPSQTARGMQNVASAPGIGADTSLVAPPPPPLNNSVFDMMSTADRQRLSSSLTNTFAVASAQAMAVGTARPGFRAMISPDEVARDNYATDPDKSARFIGYVAAKIVEAKNSLALRQSANSGAAPILTAPDHRYARLSGNMTDFQRSREKEELESLITKHQLMPSSLTTQAVVAAPPVKKPAVLDFEGAAKMKMYGRLTRTEVNWKPDKLLCKRFNVVDPWIDREFTETVTGEVKPMSDTQQRNQLLEQTIQASHGRALMAGMLQAPTQQPSSVFGSSSSRLDANKASSSSGSSTMSTLEAVLKDEGTSDSASIADLAPPPKPAVDLFKAIFEADDEEEEKERAAAIAARAEREAREAKEEEEAEAEVKRLEDKAKKESSTSAPHSSTGTANASPTVKVESKRGSGSTTTTTTTTTEDWREHDGERTALMSSLQTQIQQARERAREIEAKFHRPPPLMSPAAAAAALGGMGMPMMSQFAMSTLGASTSSMAGSLPPPPPPPPFLMKTEPRGTDNVTGTTSSHRSDRYRSDDRDHRSSHTSSSKHEKDDRRSRRSSRERRRSNSRDRDHDRHRHDRRRGSRSKSHDDYDSRTSRNDRRSSRERHSHHDSSSSSSKAKEEDSNLRSSGSSSYAPISMSALEAKSEHLRRAIEGEKRHAATRAADEVTKRLNNLSSTIPTIVGHSKSEPSPSPSPSPPLPPPPPPTPVASSTGEAVASTADSNSVLSESLLKTLAKLHKQKEKDKHKKKKEKKKDKEKDSKDHKHKKHKEKDKEKDKKKSRK
jgi:hypothetical protein